MKVTGSPQLNKGRWNAVLRITDEDGKTRQKSIALGLGEGAKKRDVNAAFKKVLRQYEERPSLAKGKIMFADWIREYLTHTEANVTGNTMFHYRTYAEKVIIPFYEGRKTVLQTMRMRDVQAFYDYCVTERSLSRSTVEKYRAVVRGALDYACRNEIIPNNPADKARIPKTSSTPIGKAYTPEQVNKLLETVKDEPIYAAVYLDLQLGLRRSELCALKWDVVDLEAKQVTIKRVFTMHPEPRIEERTKSETSRRVLPLSDTVCEFLRQLKHEQLVKRVELGPEYHNEDLVICFPDGKPMQPDYVTRKFGKVLKKHGLEKIRFHDLRHTVATLMITSEVNLKVVQEILGHASLSTTANIYAHVDIKEKREAVAKMEEAIQAAVMA